MTLTVAQIPHSHPFLASSNVAAKANTAGNVLAQTPSYLPYISGFSANTPLAPVAVGSAGGSQPHTNFQPYLCVDFIISLSGIFPSPT
ncbi:MAG: phage tail protein [Pseudonocardiaceae bacterium]